MRAARSAGSNSGARRRAIVAVRWPGLVTYVYTERDGRCLVTERSIFNSKDQRDGILQSGIEEGARETYDRFAELLEKLAKKK